MGRVIALLKFCPRQRVHVLRQSLNYYVANQLF